MPWFDADPDVLVGDAASEALKRALRRGLPEDRRTTMGEFIDALAWAMRSEGASCLERGDVLRLLWIRVSRGDTIFELGREGSTGDRTLGEALARYIRSASRIYQKSLHRKPRWTEIISNLNFVTRLCLRDFVIDPRGWDLDEPWAGWVDARGSISPQETLEAVVEVLRTRWHELVWGDITLEGVGMRLSTGEALSPRGERADPATVAEVDAVVRSALGKRHKLREPRMLEARLATVLSRRRERLLGGAEVACCVLDLDVKDARRYVSHPSHHTGFVVREIPDGDEPKVQVYFGSDQIGNGRMETVLASTITYIDVTPSSGVRLPPRQSRAVPYRPPFLLASSETMPRVLAVDHADVYWTDPETDEIMKVPKRGGEAVRVASRHGWADHLLLDDEYVYFTADERVQRMPKDGGEAETVARCPNPPSAIAVDDDYVYVADRLTGTVIAAPCDGSEVETVAAGQLGVGALAVDDDAVYWTTSEGALRRAPKDGGPLETLAETAGPAGALVVDQTCVYWLRGSFSSAAILGVDMEDGATGVVASGIRNTGFLAQDEDHVYWADPWAGAIMRVPKVGGAPEAVVEGLDRPEALVADGANIYWGDTGYRVNGAVARFPLR